MKKKLALTCGIIFAVIGLIIGGYPFISNYVNSLNADSEVVNYLNTAEKLGDDQHSKLFADAEKHNKSLVGSVTTGDPFSTNNKGSNEYYNLLKINKTDVMASVEIPKLNENLPIYHGTSTEVLKKGIGHLQSSSLPVGGTGTHAVLTGHSGLSSQKLFSDLDNLVIGDVFYIHVLNRTLAYQIDNIAVVLPTQTDLLQIDSKKDYVTLITCTPFGVNSHRLLVRGTRIAYNEAQKIANTGKKAPGTWNSEYVSAIILGLSVMFAILAIFAIVKIILHFREKRKNKS